MDPLTIAVSVSSLLIATARVSSTIHDITGKANRASTTLTAISAECSIVSSTLSQVENLVKADPNAINSKLSETATANPEIPSLEDNLRNALTSCDVTIVALSDTLEKCAAKSGRSFLGKAKFLWNEQELQERLQTLRGLNQALTGLLAAIQADSLTSVQRILNDNTAVLESMMRRSRTYRKKYVPSILSDAEVTLFEFDNQVVDSPAYRRAFHSFQASTGSRTLVENEARQDDSSFVVVDKHKDKVSSVKDDHRGQAEPESQTRLSTALPASPVVEVGSSTSPIRSPPAADPLQGLSEEERQAADKVLREAVSANSAEKVESAVAQGGNMLHRDADGLQPIHLAAKEGYVDALKALIKLGADVEAQTTDDKVFRPLHLACEHKRPRSALHLIQIAKADINATDKIGNKPINRAAMKGELQIIKALLAAGADVESVGAGGWHPLHHAAANLQVLATQLLLQRGADLEAENNNGETPLHLAAEYGAAAVIDLLITKGAQIDAITHAGDQPLIKAVTKGKTVATDTLLKRGADIEAFESKGGTALHVAAEMGHLPVAEILLARGARLDAIDKESNQPLHIAVTYDRLEVAKLMIDHKADIEARGASGWRPVHHATRNGRVEILKHLISKGCGLKYGADQGDQPLHLGTRWNQDATMKVLLEAGADIEARGEYDQTPLHIAAEVSNESIVKLLLDHKADCYAWMGKESPLHRASIVGKVENGRLIIKAGVPPDLECKQGDHAIHLAALKGHSTFIAMLLEHGADINVYNRSKGSFPLLTAAAYGQTEVVKYILTKSPNLEQRTPNGDNPLIMACWHQHIDSAKLLLEAGAKVNATSEAGMSPLHCAVSKNRLDIARLLVEHGADLTMNTHNGRTPLESAENLKFEEMAEMLRGAAK